VFFNFPHFLRLKELGYKLTVIEDPDQLGNWFDTMGALLRCAFSKYWWVHADTRSYRVVMNEAITRELEYFVFIFFAFCILYF